MKTLGTPLSPGDDRMSTEANDLSISLYHEGVATIVERCSLEPALGISPFSYGPTPVQMDPTSFRAFFSNPSFTRLRSYACFGMPSGGDSVLMEIESSVGGPQPCTISYQTSGISWQVWYDCILRGGMAILTAYLSVTNSTDVPYGPAGLRFVVPRGSGYHAFSTQRPVSLRAASTTHVELFTASEIPVYSRTVAPADSMIVLDELYLTNSDDCGLGMELPPGPIRVFQDGPPLLRIDGGTFPFAVPGDEITVRSVPSDDVMLHGGWNYETGIANIHLHNQRAEAVTVQIEETEPASEIEEASHPLHEDPSGGFRYFVVDVPARSTGRLSYRVSKAALERATPPGYQRPPGPAFTMQPVGSDLPNPHLA